MQEGLALVEDDAVIRHLFAAFAAERGIRIRVFASLQEACELLTHPPAALITDIDLPDGTGLELVRKISAEGLRVPTYALTSRVDDPPAALVDHFDGWFSKPQSLGGFETLIECLLFQARDVMASTVETR